MATTPTPNDPSFWDDISQMLGKSAAGAGAGRASEATYLSARDRTNAELYNIAQTARTQAAGQDINRATQALAADKYRSGLAGQGASEAIRGALIQNAQPVSLDWGGNSQVKPVHFTGGSSAANFTPETRAAGAALAAHGTALLNDPNSFAQGAMPSAAGANQFLPTPGLSAMPPASFWEQAAGAGSIASGLISALSKAAAGGNSSAANALKKLLGGGGGGSSSNPFGGDTSVTNTPGGPLPSWDPTQQSTDQYPLGIPGVNLGGVGQNPVSGIDTSTPNPEDPANATDDWWNQLSGE